MVTLAHGLADRGHAVDLVVASELGPYRHTVDHRVTVVDLKASRVAFSLPRLVRYLRWARPRVLVSTLDYANVVALWARSLARAATRVVVVEQNTISISAREASDWRQQVTPRLVARFYPWADHIVANSCGVADDLAAITGLPRARIEVISNPVVTAALWANTACRPMHPFFASGQPPVVLAAGRLTAQKDFPTLIRAFANVRHRHPAHLVILGEGRERPALEALVRQLGVGADVSLPGFVDNPHAYMANAAVFVLSSRWEGLPTVLIEALASGTRVVATDCPSGPREILAGGTHGALVPVGDTPAIAAAIAAALDGRTPKAHANSWRPYEVDRVVDQYARLCFENQPLATASSAVA